MSIEQLDNEKRFEDKKKSLEAEKSERFWLEKQIRRESSELINKLAHKIAEEFWIEVSQAKNLISWEVSDDLQSLKIWIEWSNIQNSEKLQDAIGSAKNSIEDLSKKHRESLKDSLDPKKYNPESHTFLSSSKILWKSIVSRAQDPQNLSDQIIGIWVGLFDSSEAVILYSYRMGKGVLLSPYHLYLLLSWKWKYPGFSKI